MNPRCDGALYKLYISLVLSFVSFSQAAGFKPNVQVFSALIGRAARRLDYVYLKTILKSMSTAGVWPNEVIIRQLEFAAQYPPNYDQVSQCGLLNNLSFIFLPPIMHDHSSKTAQFIVLSHVTSFSSVQIQKQLPGPHQRFSRLLPAVAEIHTRAGRRGRAAD